MIFILFSIQVFALDNTKLMHSEMGWVGIAIFIFLAYLFTKPLERYGMNQNNDSMIERYLLPKTDIMGYSFETMEVDLRNSEIAISLFINNKLTYNQFLKTYYWEIVSGKVKNTSNNKCSKCNSDSNLEVHHLTYKNHGREHITWETDLICLCHDCHQLEHKDVRSTQEEMIPINSSPKYIPINKKTLPRSSHSRNL